MRTPRFCRIALLVLLIIGVSECSAQAGLKTSRVTVYAVDGFGRDITPTRLRLISLPSGVEVGARFITGTASNVPYGRYDLRVDAGSMLTARREIDVDAPEVWVTVTLVLDVPIDPVAPPTLAGTIVGSCEVNSPRWVKVVALYDRVLREQQIDHEGFFMFVDVPPGVYALFIFGGPKLCHQQTVNFRRFDKPLRIVLPSDRERPE